MTLLLVGTVIYTLEAETPWSKLIQKRIAKQQPFQPKEYGVVGLWWGALASTGILTLLLGTANLWMPHQSLSPSPKTLKTSHRYFWILTALAVLLAFYLRAPRLSHSLWNDEEYAMRRFSHGSWEIQKDETSKFVPVSWADTLFENRNGNNHLLSSLVTRLSLDLWRTSTHASREAFSEIALRTPALIAGLFTIVLIALLGLESGGPFIGIGAAFLMTLLPWHIRYAVESKGYSFMLFFICLNLLAIIHALKENKLHWWIVFAVSEAGYLLSFAGSIYVAMAINVLVSIQLLKARNLNSMKTLVAFNLMGAIPVIVWMLPSIPQIMAYLKAEDSLRLGMGWPWTRDYLSALAIGFQYDNPGTLHVGTSWLMQSMTSTWFFSVFFLLVMPIAVILGLFLSFSRNSSLQLIVLAPIFAGGLAYIHNASQNNPMVVWYLLYTSISLVFAIPLAISSIGKMKPWSAPVLLTIFIITYAIFTGNVNQILRLHDRQPIRQTIAAIKETEPNSMTAVFGVSDRQSQSYDPQVHVLESESDLQECIKKSHSAGIPLYVYYCGTTVSGQRRPELMKRVTQTDEFAFVCSKPGHEEMFSYQIYRLRTPSTK